RDTLLDLLCPALDGAPWVRAAWLGGSDATGRVDSHSDLDLVLVVEDDRIEDAFDLVVDALETCSPIDRRTRFPLPTFHGHDQAIYRLRDAPATLLVDLVVQRRSATGRLLEPERHGDAVVLLDRDGHVDPPALDHAALDATLDARRADLIARFDLFQTLVTRAIDRRHRAEAAQRYVAFTLAPLVELLRHEHCPQRHDFGLRYLDRDLPPRTRDLVERLALPGDLDALRSAQIEAIDAFETAARRITGDASLTIRRP
ncbi:MAG: nucleotidyltransferase domain-containing protein, partial [Phycisphaerales bacterium]|nr:nucleotidyltransferase domain-containing protein [Phycisphaerales bacterium]